MGKSVRRAAAGHVVDVDGEESVGAMDHVSVGAAGNAHGSERAFLGRSRRGLGRRRRTAEPWRLEYWNGSAWVPVSARSPYATVLDADNRVEFAPVTTRCLRAVFEASTDGGDVRRCRAAGVGGVFNARPAATATVGERLGDRRVLVTMPTTRVGVAAAFPSRTRPVTDARSAR